MKITDWPELERPREKLLHRGASFLSDAELLALILRTGKGGMTVVDLARYLLQQFSDIGDLLSSPKDKLLALPGIGEATYVQLMASLELACRCAEYQLAKRDVLSDVESVKSYVQCRMRHLTQEVFAMLLLDNQHQLIEFRPMFYGTINAAAVYPRELVKKALAENAAAVILVHNHPSGIAEPSEADIAITRRIRDAMMLVDIQVLDHFVVGGANTVSLAQRGLF